VAPPPLRLCSLAPDMPAGEASLAPPAGEDASPLHCLRCTSRCSLFTCGRVGSVRKASAH